LFLTNLKHNKSTKNKTNKQQKNNNKKQQQKTKPSKTPQKQQQQKTKNKNKQTKAIVCNKSIMTGDTSGAGTDYSYGRPELISSFS
jgi:hypothetical protein